MAKHPDVALLERALHGSAMVVMAVRPDQTDEPTPCTSWKVGELVDHLINDLGQFKTMAEGGSIEWGAPTPHVEQEQWVPTMMSEAMALLAAWEGAEDTSAVGMQVAEVAVHTWDLARATGQTADIDDAIAERGLEWMTSSLKPEHRGSESDGKSFGPEQQAPEDASALERLVAFSGRTP